MNVDQILISDKFKHDDDGFKHFIGYKDIAKTVMYHLTSNKRMQKILGKGRKQHVS